MFTNIYAAILDHAQSKNKLGLDDVFIGSTKFVRCHRLWINPSGCERWVHLIMMHFEKSGAK